MYNNDLLAEANFVISIIFSSSLHFLLHLHSDTEYKIFKQYCAISMKSRI